MLEFTGRQAKAIARDLHGCLVRNAIPVAHYHSHARHTLAADSAHLDGLFPFASTEAMPLSMKYTCATRPLRAASTLRTGRSTASWRRSSQRKPARDSGARI